MERQWYVVCDCGWKVAEVPLERAKQEAAAHRTAHGQLHEPMVLRWRSGKPIRGGHGGRSVGRG